SAAGSLSVSANYGGDSSHNVSSGGATVTVNKRATSTTVSCFPNPVTNNTSTNCTARVSDIDVSTAITPSGLVSFVSNSTGIFTTSSCTLAATATGGVANCSVSYTPKLTGHHGITATFAGDSTHTSSNGSTTETVTQPSLYALVV